MGNMHNANQTGGPTDHSADSSDTTDASEMEQKALRKENPSGWLILTRNESVPFIVDALLDHPPRREFNKTELAEAAGVSRQSVARHLDLLLTVDVVEPVEGTSPQRYRFDPEASVSKALIRLDGEMNTAGPGTGNNIEDATTTR